MIPTGKQVVRVQNINEDGEITNVRDRVVDARYSDEEGYLYRHTENYIKKFSDSELPKTLSWSDQGKLSCLQKYIVGDSQLLGIKRNKRIEPVTIVKLQTIFKCGKRMCYNTIQEAKKNKVIKEVVIDGVAWYAYNPIYGLKNKRLSVTAFLIFQDELLNELPEWVVHEFMKKAEKLPKPVIKK